MNEADDTGERSRDHRGSQMCSDGLGRPASLEWEAWVYVCQRGPDLPHSSAVTSPCVLLQLQWVFPHFQFSSVQSLSRVRLFAIPWTTARQASLSITNSQSPPKPMSIESVMLSNHLILCWPLLLLPSIFPSIRVFSNESYYLIRVKKCSTF